MNPLQIKVKKLNQLAKLPSKAKLFDAGADLTATSYEYKNGRHIYGTSIALEIPEGYVGLIFPRSSICKYDLRLTNSVGVIDSNYRGEIKFQFENDGMSTKIYNIGDRIGQLIIMPYPEVQFEETEELSETNRGTQGFGSSGK